MSKNMEIQKWEEEQPKLKAARYAWGICEVPADDKDYLRALAEARAKLSLPESPAMPLILTCDPGSGGKLHGCGGKEALSRQHQDHISPKGLHSIDLFGLVHTPVPMKEAMNIPKAKAAVGAEWD